MDKSPLPIDSLLPEIIARLSAVGAVVLQAPPGAGKTTRVPPAVLDAGLAGAGRVLVLEPRRLAARAAAARIAAERGSPLGGEIGYQVRFEARISKSTRLAVLTEGIFARMLSDDPFLEGVGAVVFDEFHERSLYSDLTLAMVRRVRAEVRPDLKLLVMSATLDAEPVARFLDDAPVITSAGRAYPVEIAYLAEEPVGPLEPTVVDGVLRVLQDANADRQLRGTSAGDVLVFLPGVGEIRRVAAQLTPHLDAQGVALQMLFGDMPLAEQQAVLRPSDGRRVVLATNVAETSLTIEGVTAVVDSGWARQLRAEPSLGINRLALERISRASAEQRAGRAGRTAPGRCLRLWTQRRQHGLSEQSTPEIRRVDLAGPALDLYCWGERELARFPWFEAPPDAALEQAEGLLRSLGAIDRDGPTPLGRAMARLPAQPRLARLLLAGRDHHAGRLAALAAALLGERDPWIRLAPGAAPTAGNTRGRWSDSDVLDRALALEAFADRGRLDSSLGRLDPAAARQTLRVAEQLEQLLDASAGGRRSTPQRPATERDADGLLRALLAAFPDRVARRREPHSPRAAMVGGRGVRLDGRSAVRESELFLAVELEEVGKSEALVRMASSIERDWLPTGELRSETEVEFDSERERVVAWRRVRWRDLLLEEAATNVPADVDSGEVLAVAAAERLDPRDWLEEADRTLLARIACLRVWMPELNLPDWSDARLRELLPQLCAGLASFAELRRRPLAPIVRQALSGQQQAALDREAPERIRVPSGSQIAVQYVVGKPPVLAARIQEIFGWADTPRIAGGRTKVLLHLLAPNQRPQQITDDLASFWDRTYAEVRKELRRRYPKHAWPEDPRAARPERRPGDKRR